MNSRTLRVSEGGNLMGDEILFSLSHSFHARNHHRNRWFIEDKTQCRLRQRTLICRQETELVGKLGLEDEVFVRPFLA